MASHLRFFWSGLVNHVQTGALIPSQKFLINKMLRPIPVGYRGEILELGAGTGPVTLALARRCPQSRITACEINPDFAADLRARLAAAKLDRIVTVVRDAAEHLLARRFERHYPPADFVLSGIPLGNLESPVVRDLLRAVYRCMRPGSMFIQFQYSLMDRKNIRGIFRNLRTVPVLLNFPPSVVYYAQK